MASAVAYLSITGQGPDRRVALDPLPFTIGRRSTHPLVIADPHLSRDHVQIGADEQGYFLVDLTGGGGTTVNGLRGPRHRLTPGDRIEFPSCPGLGIIFDPAPDATVLMTQMRAVDRSEATGELEMLRLFLDFARRLRSAKLVGEVLAAMLDSALRLTGAERGLVFLRGAGGELEMAAARSAPGGPPVDEATISHSVVREALNSAAEFVLTGAPLAGDMASDLDLGQSIVAQGLRTVVCLPLHDPRLRAALAGASLSGTSVQAPRALGVLYLDSHAARPALSLVSQDLLRALAGEAANLVANVRLAEAEERARRLERELDLAAAIQRGLMSGEIPNLPYLHVRGHSVACRQIGGDFFDVLQHSLAGEEGATVVLADISGKGPAAALLASSLQGIAHAQLLAGRPLEVIASTMNTFLRARPVEDKYATVLLLRFTPHGELEYLNCGHQPPLLVTAAGCQPLTETCCPVGLLPNAEFHSLRLQLAPGDRLLASSDGVSDATNAAGEFFGEERLRNLAAEGADPETVVAAVRAFCAGVPFNDDCTLVEARFLGPGSATQT